MRPITANIAHVDFGRVQPFVDVNQSHDMSSAQQQDSSYQARPYSQATYKTLNKFNSMKAVMTQSGNGFRPMRNESKTVYNTDQNSAVYPGERLSDRPLPNFGQEPPIESTHDADPDALGEKFKTEQYDGFKLVSQFETEEDAMKYASELQKYYDSRNMDVKVQIEMNLEDVDDTPGQHYLHQALEEHAEELENR